MLFAIIKMVNDMNYKSIIKRQGFIIGVCVICLAVVLAGTSYALFFQVNKNSENQVIQTGTLSVSYGKESQKITETNLVPMMDTYALKSSTVSSVIYIENTGTLPAKYQLAISEDWDTFSDRDDYTDNDEMIVLDYVRVAVYKDGELIVDPTTISDLSTASNDSSMFLLNSGTLDVLSTGNSTETLVVKIWLSSETPVSEVGKFLFLKLHVTSLVDEENTPEGNVQ